MMTTPAAPRLTLRISVTERCQMHCLYCRPRPTFASGAPSDVVQAKDMVRFVDVARQTMGVAKVRLTGGEPLIRRDLVALVATLGQLALPDLALTTNGQRLAALARPLRAAGLHRINVSLDSLDRHTFARLTQEAELAPTLDGIEAACAAGLGPVRINTVVMRGINDHEVEALVAFALARGCEPRFIELMPSGLATADYQRWFMPSAELRERLARAFDLTPEAPVPGASSRRWRVNGAASAGLVGFISPRSQPFCAGCRRLRLTADGRLLGCLGRSDYIRIMGLLRATDAGGDERIAAALHVALGRKRGAGAFAVAMPMSSVGG
jgi:cyclic pyranopterin phosphate synthase